jgi:hypothetical protein
MGMCSAINIEKSQCQRYVSNFYNAIGVKSPNYTQIYH